MKAKKIEKKLIVVKSTVSDLSREDMTQQRGGGLTLNCTQYGPVCTSIYRC